MMPKESLNPGIQEWLRPFPRAPESHEFDTQDVSCNEKNHRQIHVQLPISRRSHLNLLGPAVDRIIQTIILTPAYLW